MPWVPRTRIFDSRSRAVGIIEIHLRSRPPEGRAPILPLKNILLYSDAAHPQPYCFGTVAYSSSIKGGSDYYLQRARMWDQYRVAS